MRRLIPVLSLLAAVPLAAADVYKSTDENGNVVYSDRPVPGAERVDVQTSFVGGGPAPRSDPTAREPAADADQSEQEGAEQAGEPAQTAEQRAELRAQNCEAAQARRQSYLNSRRLYRLNESGEREYLSSAQIDEARAQAAADVEEWCS